jgi:hypothetical protein
MNKFRKFNLFIFYKIVKQKTKKENIEESPIGPTQQGVPAGGAMAPIRRSVRPGPRVAHPGRVCWAGLCSIFQFFLVLSFLHFFFAFLKFEHFKSE